MPFDLEMAMCSGSGAFIHSFDVSDAGDAADGGDHPFQLPFVLDFQGHVYDGAAVGLAAVGFQAQDIGLFVEQGGGKLAQHSRPVFRANHQLHRKSVANRARPFDLNLALRVVHQVLDIAAVDRMHRDALPPRHVAHNGLAADGIAALGAIGHQVIDALDLDHQILVVAGTVGRGALGSRSGGFRNFRRHQLRCNLLQYLARGILPVTERRVQVLHLGAAVVGRDRFHLDLGYASELDAQPAGFSFEIFLADFDGLGALGGVDDVPDLVARARRFHDPQPIFAGQVVGLGQNLDYVAVAKRVPELHDTAVDLGADASVPDVGVDGVGEIDGRRAARQCNHAAFGREAVNLFRVEIHLQGGHELTGIAHIALPFDQMAEPGDALIVIGRTPAAFFVLPVRGDALFGDAMHLVGADLDFEVAALGAHDGGVQRLVEIGPRDGDKILDPSRNGVPLVMDDTQSGVTVLHRIGNDADSQKIVNLIQDDFLALELLEYGVGALHADFDARGNPFAGQVELDNMLDLVEKRLIPRAGRLEFPQQAFGGLGLQIPERQVLQFAPDLSHTQAVGDGRVNVHGFLGDAEALSLRQRTQSAHVMQAVGQLDQDDADIVDHGQQHLADAFSLAFLARGQIELAELGDPVDAAGHFVAEPLGDLFDRRGGVFDHIVEEPGLEADHVHVHVGELAGDQQRMGHVRFAGHSHLPKVPL